MTRKIQKLTVDLTQIPCPFNMRDHADRVETGPVQFNEDWPGFFLRGDATLYYAMCLENVLNAVETGESPDAMFLMSLQNLLKSMRGSRISNSIEDDNDSDVGC